MNTAFEQETENHELYVVFNDGRNLMMVFSGVTWEGKRWDITIFNGRLHITSEYQHYAFPVEVDWRDRLSRHWLNVQHLRESYTPLQGPLQGIDEFDGPASLANLEAQYIGLDTSNIVLDSEDTFRAGLEGLNVREMRITNVIKYKLSDEFRWVAYALHKAFKILNGQKQ